MHRCSEVMMAQRSWSGQAGGDQGVGIVGDRRAGQRRGRAPYRCSDGLFLSLRNWQFRNKYRGRGTRLQIFTIYLLCENSAT